MKRRLTILALTTLAVVALIGIVLTINAPAQADGAKQIRGTGEFAEAGDCNDPEGNGADFALKFEGDLDGCFYVFVETAKCSPSGTYRETGKDLFVGEYNGEFGTFGTNYRFEAKYQDCPNLAGEVFGRCQHPIVAGSGTYIFDDVTGRVDIKDDIADDGTVTFRYRGHLRW